ncbi:hypothetical protein [Micromonospora eburnea]|uniref:Oligosaccharide repeat unit polymerase n=1 Tax=Micromonospora eburnea TaxID=227316 RepID=A0A1C6U426_9ACTN|nr:hypothetical protein [Micromonospora eburnea]SCL48787.1 hypothetical protein GA0070604_1775 [Micromonospora eburnea]
MTRSVLAGLVLQAVAVWFTHRAINGQWLTRVGGQMLLMAVLFHGVTEIVQWVWPGRNGYRQLVSQDTLDDWTLTVSAAILLYALAYGAICFVWLPRAQPPPGAAGLRGSYIEGLRLRWLLLLAVLLVGVTVSGSGLAPPALYGQDSPTEGNYVLSGLVSQFVITIAGLVGAVALVRFGRRWALLLLLVQGGFLILAGSRSMVVFSAVLSLYGAALAGVRLPRRQLVGAALLVGFLAVSLSAARDAVGRDAFLPEHGAVRAEGLADGVRALSSPQSQEAILDDTVYRFDGNTFGALIYNRLQEGAQPVGLTTVWNNVLLGVPSFIDKGKLQRSLEVRNEESYLDMHFRLDPSIDYLPGMFGSMLGYYGVVGLMVLAILLGLGLAAIDRLVAASASAVRLLLGMGFVQCALSYETGPPTFITTLRGVVALIAVVLVVRWAGALVRRLRPEAAGAAWRPETPRRGPAGPTAGEDRARSPRPARDAAAGQVAARATWVN